MGYHYTLTLGVDESGERFTLPFQFPLEGLGHFSAFTALAHGQVWRSSRFNFCTPTASTSCST